MNLKPVALQLPLILLLMPSFLCAGDDPEREYAYGPADVLPNTEVGTFSDSLMRQAKNCGWAVISMKKDWKVIFSFQK